MILSYLELFGFARVSKLIFVDQAPLQVLQPPDLPRGTTGPISSFDPPPISSRGFLQPPWMVESRWTRPTNALPTRGSPVLTRGARQNRVEGWTIGSKGCYDEASLLSLSPLLPECDRRES